MHRVTAQRCCRTVRVYVIRQSCNLRWASTASMSSTANCTNLTHQNRPTSATKHCEWKNHAELVSPSTSLCSSRSSLCVAPIASLSRSWLSRDSRVFPALPPFHSLLCQGAFFLSLPFVLFLPPPTLAPLLKPFSLLYFQPLSLHWMKKRRRRKERKTTNIRSLLLVFKIRCASYILISSAVNCQL